MGDLPAFRPNVPRLGAGCPRVTQTSATGRLSPARSTCMHEARRQRSSWARIEPIRVTPLVEMPRPLTTVRLLRFAPVAPATVASYVKRTSRATGSLCRFPLAGVSRPPHSGDPDRQPVPEKPPVSHRPCHGIRRDSREGEAPAEPSSIARWLAGRLALPPPRSRGWHETEPGARIVGAPASSVARVACSLLSSFLPSAVSLDPLLKADG